MLGGSVGGWEGGACAGCEGREGICIFHIFLFASHVHVSERIEPGRARFSRSKRKERFLGRRTPNPDSTGRSRVLCCVPEELGVSGGVPVTEVRPDERSKLLGGRDP